MADPVRSASSSRQNASTMVMLARSAVHWHTTLATTYLLLSGTEPMSRLLIIMADAPPKPFGQIS